jgi:hypothetical protein
MAGNLSYGVFVAMKIGPLHPDAGARADHRGPKFP